MLLRKEHKTAADPVSPTIPRIKCSAITWRSFCVGVFFTLFLCSYPSILNLSIDASAQKPESPSTLSLIFIGDIMQHMPQVEAAYSPSTDEFDYDSCFIFVKPFISRADFTIANLETTLAGKPYSGYPAFSSPDAFVNGLIFAGIDILGTANNHCCDRGKVGIERTISVLDNLGVKHIGTYTDMTERTKNCPLIIRHKGISVALLNYTYGTNSNPVFEPNIVNLIDTALIRRDLAAAHDSMPDKIILFMHWGTEYERQPNSYQKEIASFCLKNGADIIIGSHPHVLQPMERFTIGDSLNKREVMVVWSLGNYVSNQRDRYRDGGVMIRIDLEKKPTGTIIRKAGYELTWVYTPISGGKKRYYILPVNSYIGNPVGLDSASFEKMRIFQDDSRLMFEESNKGVGAW